MKFLLVEDERFTREGILLGIPWSDLGIEQIEQAFDGEDALAIAHRFAPDIVLTDIRMPRMNGIDLAHQLRALHPYCKIIFMSGFSDKHYLKSAITLKAIEYIEKPLDLDELHEAIQTAIDLCREEIKEQMNQTMIQARLTGVTPYIKQEIALQLIRGTYDSNEICKHLLLSGIQFPFNGHFVTILVKVASSQKLREAMNELIDHTLSQLGLNCLPAFKDEHHLLLHLYNSNPLHDSLTTEIIQLLHKQMSSFLALMEIRFTLAAGVKVYGIEKIHESYNTAVIALQKTFFQGSSSLAIYDEKAPLMKGYVFDGTLLQLLRNELEGEEYEQVKLQIHKLTLEIKSYPDTFVNYVKDIYHQLLVLITGFAKERGIVLINREGEHNFIGELIYACPTLDELVGVLLDQINCLHNAQNAKKPSSLVTQIIKYIQQHYSEDQLSVQEISDHLQMTSSYLISIFKEKTGTTIKQYLMEHRMERAKELLKDKRLKIFDIATQVGYHDGEHFAKNFKKVVGITASEYRERLHS